MNKKSIDGIIVARGSASAVNYAVIDERCTKEIRRTIIN